VGALEVDVVPRAPSVRCDDVADRLPPPDGRPRRARRDVRGARRLRPLRDPGLLDCHPHACFPATASKFRFGLGRPRPRGASALPGRISSTVWSTRCRRVGGAYRRRRAATRRGCRRTGTRPVDSKSATGRRYTDSPLRAVKAGRGIPTCSAPPVPPEFRNADRRYLNFARAEFSPRRRISPGRTCFSSACPASTQSRARPISPLAATQASSPLHGDKFPEAERSASRVELAPRSVDAPRCDRPWRHSGSVREPVTGGSPCGERAFRGRPYAACARARGPGAAVALPPPTSTRHAFC